MKLLLITCGCALSAIFRQDLLPSDFSLEQSKHAELLLLLCFLALLRLQKKGSYFDRFNEHLNTVQVLGECRKARGVDSKSFRLGTIHPILLSTVQPEAACDSPTGATPTKCMLSLS